MNEIYALVVDNSPVIRRILGYVLEAEGCTVETAEDGLAALDCIARRRPDVLFTDLIMPKIDGEKLCYIIRNTPELKDIFLVVLSGVALEDNTATLQIGADVCIAKGSAAAMMVTSRRRCDGSSAISAVQAAASRGWKGCIRARSPQNCWSAKNIGRSFSPG